MMPTEQKIIIVLIKNQETNGIIASSAKQFVALAVGHVTIVQGTRALTH